MDCSVANAYGGGRSSDAALLLRTHTTITRQVGCPTRLSQSHVFWFARPQYVPLSRNATPVPTASAPTPSSSLRSLTSSELRTSQMLVVSSYRSGSFWMRLTTSLLTPGFVITTTKGASGATLGLLQVGLGEYGSGKVMRRPGCSHFLKEMFRRGWCSYVCVSGGCSCRLPPFSLVRHAHTTTRMGYHGGRNQLLGVAYERIRWWCAHLFARREIRVAETFAFHVLANAAI